MLITAAAILLLQYPEKILTSSHFQSIVRRVLPPEDRLDWSAMDLQTRSLTALKKRITLKLDRPCFRAPDVSVCFQRLELDVDLDFASLRPRLDEVRTLTGSGGDVRIHPAESSGPARSGAPEPLLPRVPPLLAHTRFDRIDLLVPRWSYEKGETKLAGSLSLSHAPQGSWSADVEEKERDWKLRLRQDGLAGNLLVQAAARRLPRPFWSAETRGCSLQIVDTPAKLALRCDARFNLRRYNWRTLPAAHAPKAIDVRVSLDLASRQTLSLDAPMSGNADVSVLPITVAGLSGQARVGGAISGTLAKVPEGWRWESNAEVSLKIEDFKKIVTLLRGTPYAVPAPFHALSGAIDLTAQGKAAWDELHLPFRLRTTLHSTHQMLLLDGTGRFERSAASGGMHVDGDLLLSEVQLALPHLAIGPPPQFLPDKRIQRAADRSRRAEAGTASSESGRSKGAGGFHYDVRIHTGAHPAHLLSNLTGAPVPLTLDLRVSDTRPITGRISVQSFPVELFRRKAQIDRVDIGLSPQEKTLNGDVTIAYTDYTIHAHLSGTFAKPALSLSSDPPLPENEIASALLYGTTVDQLTPDQAQSSGNFATAVSEQGLNLASMFVLASTPVESVSYDPSTKTVNARVRVASGVSLNVSSSSEGANVAGVRVRLGPSWAITTQVGNPSDPNDKSVSAFLEWGRRY